jgi:hypothetical protein
MVRQGEHPLGSYGAGHLAPRVAQALGRVLLSCHANFGAFRLFASSRRASFVPCNLP